MSSESGGKLLARLGSKPDLTGLEPALFESGPTPGCVYELYGESGSGKSQAVLHVVSRCLLPVTWCDVTIGGRGGAVLLIDTDYNFPIMRLAEIMEKMVRKQIDRHFDAANQNSQTESREQVVVSIEKLLKSCLHNLHVVQCPSLSNLLVTMATLENICANDSRKCLLVLDSVCSLYDCTNSAEFRKYFPKFIDKLQQLVSRYKLVLLVTKSVLFQSKDSKLDTEEEEGAAGSHSARVSVFPHHHEFLGRLWTQTVSHRLVFSAPPLEGAPREARQLRTDAGYTRQRVVRFTIDSDGLNFLL